MFSFRRGKNERGEDRFEKEKRESKFGKYFNDSEWILKMGMHFRREIGISKMMMNFKTRIDLRS